MDEWFNIVVRQLILYSLPLLVAIGFHRGVIVALPKPLSQGLMPTILRVGAHTLLCMIGFFLYAWSLSHQPPSGLPPLHHWWAKVLMFFNLCMVALHLLPLPLLLVGELAGKTPWLRALPKGDSLPWIVLALLVATPLVDMTIGALVIYPVYEWLSSLAMQLSV